MASEGLFIGIDRYASAETNWLSCARRETIALHALFSDTLGGETVLLTDGQATAAATHFFVQANLKGCSFWLFQGRFQ